MNILYADIMLDCDLFFSSGDVCEEHLLGAGRGGGGTTRGDPHDGPPQPPQHHPDARGNL